MSSRFLDLARRALLTVYAVLVISAILWGLAVLVRNIIHEMAK